MRLRSTTKGILWASRSSSIVVVTRLGLGPTVRSLTASTSAMSASTTFGTRSTGTCSRTSLMLRLLTGWTSSWISFGGLLAGSLVLTKRSGFWSSVSLSAQSYMYLLWSHQTSCDCLLMCRAICLYRFGIYKSRRCVFLKAYLAWMIARWLLFELLGHIFVACGSEVHYASCFLGFVLFLRSLEISFLIRCLGTLQEVLP